MLRCLAVLCGLTMVVAGCGDTRTESAAPGDLTVGVSIELTGAGSVMGSAHGNALRLAADQLNAAGAHIRLAVKDNRSNPAAAAENVKTFAADGVKAIVGGGTVETGVAVADAAEKAKVPAIVLGPSPGAAPARQWVFSTPPDPNEVADTLVREFVLRDVRSIGIMAVSGEYGDAGTKALQSVAAQRDIRVVGIERFAESDKNADAQAARFTQAKPNAVVVWAPVPGAGVAARSLRDSQFTDHGGKVYFDAGVGAELFLRDAGSAAEGALVVNPLILAVNQTTATTPSVLAQKEFVIKYTQRYGTFSGYACYSADALALIAQAVKDAGADNRPAIRSALEKVTYEGLSGSYEFTAKHHGGVGGDALAVLQVRDNGWVLAP
jgi:branched-chain amino acid transport system substrate-binding protein